MDWDDIQTEYFYLKELNGIQIYVRQRRKSFRVMPFGEKLEKGEEEKAIRIVKLLNGDDE